MQLAGHLKNRALVKWNLPSTEKKPTFSLATQALQASLDPGSKLFAAQYFRHALQKEDESSR